MKKFVKIFIFMIAIIICFFSYTYGFELNQLNGTGGNTGSIENVGNEIITIISTIGSVISVVTLIALGIKYMLGSVEEKATYKKTFMPYVVGASLVFAASFITSLIYNFAIQI